MPNYALHDMFRCLLELIAISEKIELRKLKLSSGVDSDSMYDI